MKRDATKALLDWSKAADRKPLIVRGARQVGKTWLIEMFGREHIGNCVRIDLEKLGDSSHLFSDPSPRKNIQALEVFVGQKIEPGKTLLFLDEIQAAPKLLSKLRYFYEEVPNLHVVVTGSLLDVALAEYSGSMPVGRVSYLFLEPMSFLEFLDAIGESRLRQFIEEWQVNTPVLEPIHTKFLKLIREYSLVGGMPAVVAAYVRDRSFLNCHRVQTELLATYRDDFNKYASRASVSRLRKTLASAARLVGQKYVYRKIDAEDRSAPLRQAIELLAQARVCHMVMASHGNGIPLAAEVDHKTFKVIYCDTGLMLAALSSVPIVLKQGEDITLVNSGAIAEQLVGQMLRMNAPLYSDPALFYWAREKKGAEAEIDYLIQSGTDIIPVEVKAGSTGSLKSLHLFMKEKKSRIGVKISSAPFSFDGKIYSVPFYLVSQLESKICHVIR